MKRRVVRVGFLYGPLLAWRTNSSIMKY